MVHISADSTCDLTPAMIQKMNVAIAHNYVIMGDRSYMDGLDICPDDIVEYVNKTGKLCKTASSSVLDYESLFARLTADGGEVVHMTVGSELSACYQNACIAARKFSGVYVVDSQNLSTGIGHLVCRGAELAREDKSGEEILRELEQMSGRLESSFIVENLEYLCKGGRCSSLMQLGANLLRLRPCIEVHGTLSVGKKYRGAFARCMTDYAADKLRGRDDIDPARIFITHCACAPEWIEAVREACLSYQPFREVIVTNTGCTITNHCGPHTLGLLFLRKE